MDQNHATKHLSHGHRLLLAIGYARVGQPLRVKPEKITVLCHQDASGGGSKLKVLNVSRADQARVRRGRHVDIAPPKTIRDVGGDVFVKMKADGHWSG
jgi:hypothetical protein